MAFDRWVSWYSSSRTFHRFKIHHTEISDNYWSFVPVANAAKYTSRQAGQQADAAAVFHATGPHARRVAASIAEWNNHFEEFENWTRLSMLLSALSYLETYITSVVTLALRSDPLLRFGQTKTVDGVVWLKNSVSDDIQELVQRCTRKEWTTRVSEYRRLFGSIPDEVQFHIGDLEKMRKLRNGVAHSFGRDLSKFEDPLTGVPVKAARLSEHRLIKWLGIIELVAKVIDDQLLLAHLGAFEEVSHFHRWQAQPRAKKEPRYDEAAAFSRHLIRTWGVGPGRDHCRQLVRYYKQK